MTKNYLPSTSASDDLRFLALIAYALNLAGLVTGGLGSIAAVVLAYIKRSDSQGSIWESHFTFIIRTFWISVIAGIISVILIIVLIGFLGLTAIGIWIVIRMVFGLVKAYESKSIPNPESWLV